MQGPKWKSTFAVALSSAVLQKPGRILRQALEVEGDSLSLSTHMGPSSCLVTASLKGHQLMVKGTDQSLQLEARHGGTCL